MKVNDFLEWSKEMVAIEERLMIDKGIEYTVSDDDKLKNFKSLGERLHISPQMVAMIYLLKHMDSIRNYVLKGVESSNEPIMGRINDARNFLLLLGAIINETQETPKN